MQNLENIVASLAATAASLTKLTSELTKLANSLKTETVSYDTNIASPSVKTENVSYDTNIAETTTTAEFKPVKPVENPINHGDEANIENLRIDATQAASRLRQDGVDAKAIKSAVARIGKDTGAVKIGELSAAQISQLLVVFDELSATI